MALFRCIGKCGRLKTAPDDFYENNSKRGHTTSCKVCICAATRLRNPPTGNKQGRPKGTVKTGPKKAKKNYYVKKTLDFQRRANPTPEQIAHGTWLVRAAAFFDKFFSMPVDKRNCVRCPRECKHSLRDIVDSDYY
ncbi:hypothetical protein LCGC14_2515280 [marine sediment metagenome]|uniref:Uncharacterized protein n=1 Tax=marine sediment metagenome TaxID=412755 RepID=A0A0F9AYH1_9ZZZZ